MSFFRSFWFGVIGGWLFSFRSVAVSSKLLPGGVVHCALGLVALVVVPIRARLCTHWFFFVAARQLPCRLSVLLAGQSSSGFLHVPAVLCTSRFHHGRIGISAYRFFVFCVGLRKFRFFTSTSRRSSFGSHVVSSRRFDIGIFIGAAEYGPPRLVAVSNGLGRCWELTVGSWIFQPVFFYVSEKLCTFRVCFVGVRQHFVRLVIVCPRHAKVRRQRKRNI